MFYVLGIASHTVVVRVVVTMTVTVVVTMLVIMIMARAMLFMTWFAKPQIAFFVEPILEGCATIETHTRIAIFLPTNRQT